MTTLWDATQTRDPNMQMAWVANNAPRIPWETFISHVFDPEPGEHVLTIGYTGSGKTHLQNSLLYHWPFVAAFGTKRTDATMERLITHAGYERYARWWPMSSRDHPRRVIWPPASDLKTMVTAQTKVFEHAMERIWAEGGRPKDHPIGWAVAMDEAWWFANVLKLGQYIKIYCLQGRSNGVSLLAASQRPAFIPTELYSSATHLFFFHDTDKRNLDRIGEINYKDSGAVRYIVNRLEKFQVLYVNTRTGVLLRTRAPERVAA